MEGGILKKDGVVLVVCGSVTPDAQIRVFNSWLETFFSFSFKASGETKIFNIANSGDLIKKS